MEFKLFSEFHMDSEDGHINVKIIKVIPNMLAIR